ncbi:MAG: type II toxin-antitoxin system VapC family toxin [Acidobacteria bacterium]|nr:type II toxin-antitoxin system VapC family toxin [Acidobacteriota bacterium]
MSLYFDTSATAKLYHAEIGSAVVEGLVAKGQSIYLSRLGVLEMHSVLSGKVRTGALTQVAADKALKLFRNDVRSRRFRIATLRIHHYELAEKLIAVHGTASALRTLDSLQLAVALDLARGGVVSTLVTSDKTMIRVAAQEQILCIDPAAALP